ncbi:MAG: hypothetical protein JWM80_3035, partial [Cyanobacteria bacterium RYN_339]|nr:hypothetical protein [Cyanobacteria bacterium RYN_339]
PPPPPPPPPPLGVFPIATLTPLAPVFRQSAAVPTTGRIRCELQGDSTTGPLLAKGPAICTLPATQFLRMRGNIFLAGTTTSIFPGGEISAEIPVTAAEAGVAVGLPGANLISVIFPALAGVGVGPPIFRVQAGEWLGTLGINASTDLDMSFVVEEITAPGGTTVLNTWTGSGHIGVLGPPRVLP